MLSNITESDCGVIACQAVTGLSRAEAERLCRERGDYEDGQGISRAGLSLALMSVGYKVEPVSCAGDTAATFSMAHEYGKYLIYTEGHVEALVEGDLYNTRRGSHKRVEEAFRVVAP